MAAIRTSTISCYPCVIPCDLQEHRDKYLPFSVTRKPQHRTQETTFLTPRPEIPAVKTLTAAIFHPSKCTCKMTAWIFQPTILIPQNFQSSFSSRMAAGKSQPPSSTFPSPCPICPLPANLPPVGSSLIHPSRWIQQVHAEGIHLVFHPSPEDFWHFQLRTYTALCLAQVQCTFLTILRHILHSQHMFQFFRRHVIVPNVS